MVYNSNSHATVLTFPPKKEVKIMLLLHSGKSTKNTPRIIYKNACLYKIIIV